MRGGYQPLSRLEQDIAELKVGVGVYPHFDEAEDRLVERQFARQRRAFANYPSLLAQVERDEAEWLAADSRADMSVAELLELAEAASGHIQAAAGA
jgi:hypothetical protein